MKHTIIVNDERFEILFTCHGSLIHFGDMDIEIEEIICLSTGCEVDADDIITPEIEAKLIDYFCDNYDPTPYE